MNLFELFVKIGVKDEASKGIKDVEKAMKDAKKPAEDYRKDVMKLAHTYKSQGMSMSEAMKKAYSEIDKSQYQTTQNSKTDSKKFVANWNDAGDKIKNIASKIGNGLKTAAKIGTAAVSVAATGITALTTAAVKNYAEYEQLVGGVETLFKKSANTVKAYAENAYKTTGMSANEYMSNATAFSASLISSLGGDTEAAAEYANRAMVSMSDNANKMGTQIDSIVMTYQSLARGNFAMLDNLKLGYGGTKAELERLIKDASTYTDVQKEMGITVDASSTSFDNIVNAIAVVQGHLGIAGATALEAGTTIEGSVNSMKSAWKNLVTGIADGNADIKSLIDNLVTTIVGDGTEKNLGVVGNILPAFETALGGIGQLVGKLAPIIGEKIPTLVGEILPILVNSSIDLISSLIKSIQDNSQMLVDGAISIGKTLANGILSMLPEFIKLGLDIIISLATGISQNSNAIISAIIDTITMIILTLTNAETLSKLLTAGLTLIISLVEGLLSEESINGIIDAVFILIDNLIAFLLDTENIKKIQNASIRIVVALAKGLISAVGRIATNADKLIKNLIDRFKKVDWGEIGRNAVYGIWNGIADIWSSLVDWFMDGWNNLVGGIKDLLGIHSPSRVFEGIAKNMALGVGVGWKDTFGGVKDDITKSFDFGNIDYGITTSATNIGNISGYSNGYGMSGGSTDVNVTIGFDDDSNGMGLARWLYPKLKAVEKEVYA